MAGRTSIFLSTLIETTSISLDIITGPIIAALSLLLTAGAIVLILLTLLAGVVSSVATDPAFFLEATTSDIPNAPRTAQWTFWNSCHRDSTDATEVCGVDPAYPLDPTRNFDTTENVPDPFIGTSKFYLLTRFMFAFTLIGIVFAVCSLLVGILALCVRIGALLSSISTFGALFFQTLAATLMSVAYIQGRNAFRSNDQEASIGQYAFGYMWGAMVCLFLSTVMFCIAGSKRGNPSSANGSKRSGTGFMGRRSRSTRSRGSLRKDFA